MGNIVYVQRDRGAVGNILNFPNMIDGSTISLIRRHAVSDAAAIEKTMDAYWINLSEHIYTQRITEQTHKVCLNNSM